MKAIDIKEYANKLYLKTGNAIVPKRAVIEGGDWHPEPNMCHHNVTIWCENMPGYKPVRGWLYFDLPGLNYVKFVAHSVVRTPEGEIYDITPSNASQDYPFVECDMSSEKYAELVETRGFGEINYFQESS